MLQEESLWCCSNDKKSATENLKRTLKLISLIRKSQDCLPKQHQNQSWIGRVYLRTLNLKQSQFQLSHHSNRLLKIQGSNQLSHTRINSRALLNRHCHKLTRHLTTILQQVNLNLHQFRRKCRTSSILKIRTIYPMRSQWICLHSAMLLPLLTQSIIKKLSKSLKDLHLGWLNR